ncbi:MAG: alpha/beta hydrolase [Lachnospiraceae bacterium]|nr:alpha/beta hydrolase [Lachnospiraceae bacterium]
MSFLLKKMIQKQRADFAALSEKRDATLLFPDDVTVIENISYRPDAATAHRMDVFRPSATERTLPIIINVHGGGLMMGTKEFNRFFCAQLCKLGFVVFSIEYRLIPEVTVFDQLGDITAAMDFVKYHSLIYGGDPLHIYMVGDSAGAYLITYAVAISNNPVLANASGVTPSGLHVNALGLISGMFYTRRMDEIGLFLPKLLYGKSYRHSPFFPYTNPEHPEIIKHLPPCFLVTSHDDHLHHYTADFAAALKRIDKRHRLIDYDKDNRLTHAFSVFEPTMDKSLEVLEKMTGFLLRN